MKIEVRSTEVTSRTIQGQRGEMIFRDQDGYWHKSEEPYPVKISIGLDKMQPAFAEGIYLVSEKSFYVNNYGKLAVGRLDLKSQKAAN